MTKFTEDKQFAYWLQGYFEIGRTTDLTADQALGIMRSAASIDKDKRGALSTFVLNTLLTQPDLRLAGRQISAKLNETFIHEIDPNIPGNQEQNRRAHNGDKPLPPGVQAMC